MSLNDMTLGEKEEWLRSFGRICGRPNDPEFQSWAAWQAHCEDSQWRDRLRRLGAELRRAALLAILPSPEFRDYVLTLFNQIDNPD